MHHSQDDQSRVARRFEEQMRDLAERKKLGATGQFPEGKLDDSDEGEIQIAVGTSNGKVILNFGKPVAWMGMSPKQAREIAEAIRQHSYKAEGK